MPAKAARQPFGVKPLATTPIEPLKITPPPKLRRRLETFEGSNLEDIVKLADKLSSRWPKTAEDGGSVVHGGMDFRQRDLH